MMDNPLHNPDHLKLDDAYRGLPLYGEIILAIDATLLESTLSDLEKIGFVAIEIRVATDRQRRYEVRAYKGKHGPCYDTGRKAVYTGGALACLDDDNHLLLAGEGSPVCEKTATIYQLQPYHNVIYCSEAVPELKAKLQDQPVPFDCNTFAGDQEKILEKLNSSPEAGERVPLFYPGPCRLLILRDGTIVRRGRVNSVPASETKALIEKDRLVRWEGPPPAAISFFQDGYAEAGLQDIRETAPDAAVVETDLLQVRNISPATKERLSRLIEKDRKYFILTGSDPSDPFGCCPSEEVAQANMLVSAGILSRWSQEPSSEGCPVTIYAFKGELKAVAGELQFQPDEAFRGRVKAALDNSRGQTARTLTRWILLAFVTVSLLFAFGKMKESSASVSLQAWFEQLNPAQEDRVMLLLFHYDQRCRQCRNMEIYTNDVLEEHFGEAVNRGMLRFRLINMDEGPNREVSRQLGLFSATLVLVRFDGSSTAETRAIEEAWTLYDKEKAFKKMMKQELDQFLGNHDE